MKESETQAINGPFELDELVAKLKAGELPAGALARGDFGEGLARIQNTPPADWVPIESILGWSGKRPPNSEFPPLPPPPIPPPHPSGIAFCPACGHKLAPDVGSACGNCGKALTVYRQELARSQKSTPDALLPKAAVAAGGGCMAVVGAMLMFLGILFLIGFLLLLNLMSKCKA